MSERWQNQEEALKFALDHPASMLDMEMGTGKTRVAIDTAYARKDVYRVLVVCPKAVIPVWRENLEKFAPNSLYSVWDDQKGSVNKKTESLREFLKIPATKQFVVINYDAVWRGKMGELVLKSNFHMVILDESHRAKSAGSKISKYLAILGRRVKYKMCLSGTPMANSPLDVYGQYRFLNPDIFGTNYNRFLQEYAIMGGPERRFVVGFKNQRELNKRFKSIAYTCKMSDIADRIKLPEKLPPVKRLVNLSGKDMSICRSLNKEFIAECEEGNIVVNSVLVKIIRLQQITSGFCQVRPDPFSQGSYEDMNTVKEDELVDMLGDISPKESVVVFCVFTHDIKSIRRAAERSKRNSYEISGDRNEIDGWKNDSGSVLAVQIRAGAEGIDMTKSHHAVYFSLPHSLSLYNQSMARLHRPGQNHRVVFYHLVAKGTIDESIYKSLEKKNDVIDSIKSGTFDVGSIK